MWREGDRTPNALQWRADAGFATALVRALPYAVGVYGMARQLAFPIRQVRQKHVFFVSVGKEQNELAAKKIRVNQIIPGRIDTDRVRHLVKGLPGATP